MGSVVVNTVSYQQLTVANDSSCDLHYKLVVEQSVSGPYANDDEQLTMQDDQPLGNCSYHQHSTVAYCQRAFRFITIPEMHHNNVSSSSSFC